MKCYSCGVEAERTTILYTGRVQGVGFRWRCVDAIQNGSVTGYVRNLDDGGVELVMEGLRDELAAAAALVRAALGAQIDAEQATSSPTTGEFSSMEIRR